MPGVPMEMPSDTVIVLNSTPCHRRIGARRGLVGQLVDVHVARRDHAPGRRNADLALAESLRRETPLPAASPGSGPAPRRRQQRSNSAALRPRLQRARAFGITHGNGLCGQRAVNSTRGGRKTDLCPSRHREQLAGIHQAVGIEGLFQRAHQLVFHPAPQPGQLIALHGAHAVLGAEAAAEFVSRGMHLTRDPTSHRSRKAARSMPGGCCRLK